MFVNIKTKEPVFLLSVIVCLVLSSSSGGWSVEEQQLHRFPKDWQGKKSFITTAVFPLIKTVTSKFLGMWMRIRLDPHSFSLLDLDPDPGGKNLKNARQLVIIITYNFDQLHGFFYL